MKPLTPNYYCEIYLIGRQVNPENNRFYKDETVFTPFFYLTDKT